MNRVSTMRQAFFNMDIKPDVAQTHGSIITSAIRAAERGSGTREVREWNAHLRLRTYNNLKTDGIMV